MIDETELKVLSVSSDEHVRILAGECLNLREAIRTHKDKSGHSLCWLNDLELWKAIDPSPHYAHETLPKREEFLRQCAVYHQSRLDGSDYEEPEAKDMVRIKANILQ